MRLIFLGTPRAAVPSLQALIHEGHEIPLVVTQPDRPAGRSRRPVSPPVRVAADEAGIPVVQPERIRNREFRESLAAIEPELLVVVAYGRILSRRALDLAPRGAVNLHFSLLPAYRGAAPVQWALARGERITGVTSMLMNERMDEGDLLFQREVPVEEGEHAPALEERLSGIGAALLVETLDGLRRGSVTPRPQDHGRATLAPILKKADGEISPDLEAREIEGRVRGFDPWPGVWLRRSGRRIRIVEARAAGEAGPDDVPGMVLGATPEGLLVACGGGTRLLVRRLQPEGGKILTAKDAVNGRQIRVGDRLERAGAEG